MKATKIFISVLLGFLALAMSSCNSPEYRPTDGGCAFVIKKIDGKRQWGLVDNWDRNIEFIPCQYDSIFSTNCSPYEVRDLFIAVKNGKKYAIECTGRKVLGGRAFSSIMTLNQNPIHNKSVYGGGALFHEMETAEGRMYFCLPRGNARRIEFGPAETVLWGEAVVVCKRNEKWGVLNKQDYSTILPFAYDAIISVRELYFWVKKDGKWSALRNNRKVIRKSTSLLNKYLNLPALDDIQYQKEENHATFRKISIEEASHISVNPSEANYIAW